MKCSFPPGNHGQEHSPERGHEVSPERVDITALRHPGARSDCRGRTSSAVGETILSMVLLAGRPGLRDKKLQEVLAWFRGQTRS